MYDCDYHLTFERTQSANGVRVDDTGSTACDHGPDPSLGIQDGELEEEEEVSG